MHNSVGLLGYGRFGKILAKLLQPHYDVKVYDPHFLNTSNKINHTVTFLPLADLTQEKNLFIAVPIHKFKSVIQNIAPQLSPETTVLDVCSIKCHSVKIMQHYLPHPVGIIATHPLFGPDSIQSQTTLNFMMYPVRDSQHQYVHWKHFFGQQFKIIEMTPDEHDRWAAQSQSVVHFVARLLKATHFHPTPIDTVGCQQLQQLIQTHCKDTTTLFQDLIRYNTYSKSVLDRLEEAFNKTKAASLKDQ